MTNSIVEKLKILLREPIRREADAVYLLVECRKLLEQDKPAGCFALKLYCNWAVHVDLTYPNTTAELMRRIDDFAARKLSGRVDIVADHHLFRDFVFLESFRVQLRDFLRGHKLPTAICDDDRQWHDFLEVYSGVIEDGSLRCESSGQPLAHIRSVTFRRENAVIDEPFVPFNLVWDVELLDGRIMAVSANAAELPDAGNMIVHGVGFR